jgi:5-hydroxyisourate hydrolase
MNGRPGGGISVDLFRIEEEGRARLKAAVTNEDGRCDAPLLSEGGMQAGVYELVFHVGSYFRKLGVDLPEPSFLDRVPVRFGIADAAAHYHVPLLVSPFGYTTYRGS